MGHYPNTALKNQKKKKFGAGEWPKLFREINVSNCVIVCVPLFLANFPEGLNAPSTAHGARSAASSDGAATESLL